MDSRITRIPDITSPSLHWGNIDQQPTRPSADWVSWLTDPGSLTQALREKSGGQFRVQVEDEAWITVDSAALRACFGPLAENHPFWSRKVTLFGCDEPWVMAHTLVPAHSFHSPLREVVELNSRPLGEYLFSQPDLRRSSLEFTPWLDGAWGRRSLFQLHAKPVMVAEFFLPALLDGQAVD